MAKTKLRKMLGKADSKESADLMALIDTQSKTTLSAWAIGYAKTHYLTIYEEVCPGDERLNHIVSACEEYLQGGMKLNEVKPFIRQAGQIARDITDDPVAQAAARAVSTACAVIQTPTNTLGFLFYGAAATAYNYAGLSAATEIYDDLAQKEFRQALASLAEAAVQDEPNPVKVKWSC